jgi:type IV pilus assembly protein PilB
MDAQEIATLQARVRTSRGTSVAKAQRRRIGDILRESGVVTPDQLTQALERQRKTRERLGRVLVDLGMATERQIAQDLADQLGRGMVYV